MALSPASMRSMTTIGGERGEEIEREDLHAFDSRSPRRVNIENLDLDVEIGDIEWGHPFKGE
jgi:hypothetical protein